MLRPRWVTTSLPTFLFFICKMGPVIVSHSGRMKQCDAREGLSIVLSIKDVPFMSCPTCVTIYVASAHLFFISPCPILQGDHEVYLRGLLKKTQSEKIVILKIQIPGLIIIISLFRKVISLEGSCDKTERASNKDFRTKF